MSGKQAGIALAVITVLLQMGIFVTRGEAFDVFISKTDLKDYLQVVISPITSRLDRIERKLDQTLDK